jgi:hypothetical protein
MEITLLPISSEISWRPVFRWIYIFVEESSQRIGLIQVVYIEFLHNHHVKGFVNKGRRTFGMGKNMVGTMSVGTYISGTSSWSLSDEGGGGTSLLRFGRGDVGACR